MKKHSGEFQDTELDGDRDIRFKSLFLRLMGAGKRARGGMLGKEGKEHGQCSTLGS